MTKLRKRTKETLYNASLPSERKVSSLESNLLLSKRIKTTALPQSQKGTLNKDKLSENITKMQSNSINDLSNNMENILDLLEKLNLNEMFFLSPEKEEEITQNKMFQKGGEEIDSVFKETINYAVLPETEPKFEATAENINTEEMFISLHVENMD